MRYFPQQVPLFKAGVRDQKTDVCFQGYFRIVRIRNTKPTERD